MNRFALITRCTALIQMKPKHVSFRHCLSFDRTGNGDKTTRVNATFDAVKSASRFLLCMLRFHLFFSTGKLANVWLFD